VRLGGREKTIAFVVAPYVGGARAMRTPSDPTSSAVADASGTSFLNTSDHVVGTTSSVEPLTGLLESNEL
jgi:hypothetical protein